MDQRILVVEDDLELQELYALMLEEIDCELIPALDGGEALDKIHGLSPDLIILDILLDEVMGNKVFLDVKRQKRYADIPVIIASVLPPDSCQNLLEMDTQTVYLQKPFRKAQLLDLVKTALRQNGG